MAHKYVFDQSDLNSLCADRELETSEIHATNDFYGQASVLKRFAGIPKDETLRVVLEHGINLDDQMWDHDRDSTMPMILSPSNWRAKIHHQLSGKKSVPVGFGYLYAKEIVERDNAEVKNRCGTLAFPVHSTHTIQAKFSHEEFADRLLALPAEFHPITICAYWKNYLLGDHLPYERKGINVVSAGHMFDTDFLLRFHDLCRNHKYATSNEIGTHLFMTVASGCSFFYLDSSPVVWHIPENELINSAQQNELFQQNTRRSRQLFSEPMGSTTADQRKFVDDLMGTESLCTPKQLCSVLNRAERIHRRQLTKQWLARRLSKLSRIKRSIVKRLPWLSGNASNESEAEKKAA